MSFLTEITIDGTPVDLSLGVIIPISLNLPFTGIDTYSFGVRGIAIPAVDPYCGKSIQVSVNSTLYHDGTIMRRDGQSSPIGMIFSYTSLGLMDKGDWFPVIDDNTNTDCASFNLPATDFTNYVASRAGRTVGEIITTVLQMDDNAANLDSVGIGGYSGTTLNSTTVSDLAAMTIIPPYACHIQGERLLSAITSFIETVAPNYGMTVRASDGVLRFLDKRLFTPSELTLDDDPIEMAPFSRDLTDSHQKVIVKGTPLAVPVWVSLADGTLLEDFTYAGHATNAAAKADWTPNSFIQPGASTSSGTCTCSDTVTVVVDPTDNTLTWASNALDQSSGNHSQIFLRDSGGSGITQQTSRRIVSNTSLSASGTSTLTLDFPLDITSYDHYSLRGDTAGGNIVWRKYSISNTDIGHAMQNYFSYPAVWTNSSGTLGELITKPSASICYSLSGSPPFTEVPMEFTQDPSDSSILLLRPSSLVFGGGAVTTEASDIRVLLAVAQDTLTAIAPSSSYEGTSYSVDGLTKTKFIYCDQWKDPINQSAMNDYAQDLLDSMKDAVVEGSVTYHGLYETALTYGNSLTVTGASFTTGWENNTSFSSYGGLNIVDVDLIWNTSGDGGDFFTTMLHVSNRRAHFTAAEFLRPDRTFVPMGGTSIFTASPFALQGGDTNVGNTAFSAEDSSLNGYNMSMSDLRSQANKGQTDLDSSGAMRNLGSRVQNNMANLGNSSQNAMANLGNQTQNSLANIGNSSQDATANLAPNVAPGYGGDGSYQIPQSAADLGIPTIDDFNIPQTPKDLGIPTTLNEALGGGN